MIQPNCVQLEYMCESPDTAYLVMEYIEGGELLERIINEENEGKGLGEKLTKFYAYQLLQAVEVALVSIFFFFQFCSEVFHVIL